MREIVVKNITSENKRKKDLYITEIVEKNGLKTITRRHSLYILRRHNKIGDPNELIVNQSGLEMNNKTKQIVNMSMVELIVTIGKPAIEAVADPVSD